MIARIISMCAITHSEKQEKLNLQKYKYYREKKKI